MGTSDPLVRQFRKFDTSLVSDVLDTFDGGGVITGIPPVETGRSATGRARPMEFERVEDQDGPTNFPYAMLDCITEGEVFVIDGPAPDISCWGGNASLLAANGGLNGVVIDGGYRDVERVRRSSVPVFGVQPTPRTGQRRIRVATTDEPTAIGAVEVAPRDIVVADPTGVVVVPTAIASEVATAAEEKLAEELLVTTKIENGASVSDLRNDDHQF